MYVFGHRLHLNVAATCSTGDWVRAGIFEQNQVLGDFSRQFSIWHESCSIAGQNDLETGWPERLNTGAFVWAGQSSNPGEWVFIEALSPILHPTRAQSPGLQIDPL